MTSYDDTVYGTAAAVPAASAIPQKSPSAINQIYSRIQDQTKRLFACTEMLRNAEVRFSGSKETPESKASDVISNANNGMIAALNEQLDENDKLLQSLGLIASDFDKVV